MHVPKTNTSELELVDFYSALEKSRLSQDKYDYSKWLYVPNFYSEYRYILGTIGKKPLICVGINPSTAEPDNLDNTLKSVQRIALCNGFDSFIMFNVYAQRATNPDDMEHFQNKYLHAENMKAFDYILKNAGPSPCIWAAWGTVIEKRAYLFDCVYDMVNIGKKYSASWVCCGPVSKKGHPHHPLYLKKDSPLEPFNTDKYIEKIPVKTA